MKRYNLTLNSKIEEMKEKISDAESARDSSRNIPSQIEQVRYINPEELGIMGHTYTQSTIFPFEVKKSFFDGKYGTENYIIKEYEDNLFTKSSALRNYNVEKIIYPIIKSEEIFADLVYFEDNHLRLYLEGLMLKPLNKRVRDAKADEKLMEATSVFEPLKKCFEKLDKYNSKIKTELSKKEIEFKDLGGEYYDRKINDYLNFLKNYPFSGLLEKLSAKKNKIIDLLANEELKRIGPRDLHPWHNLGSKLIDIEGLCRCSIGLPLGCSIGHSSIYGLLPDKKDFNTLIEIFWNGFDRNIDINKLKDAIYSGAIFGNLREASGLLFNYGNKYMDSVEKNIKTAESQMEQI